MSETVEDRPPIKPARLSVKLEESGSALAVRYRQRQWGSGIFLGLWLCGWTVGCVFLAYQLWMKPELFMFVFAIPFWASWLFVASLLLSMFLQDEELLLDEAGIVFTKTLLLPLSRRVIPLTELKRFEAFAATNLDIDEAPVNYVKLITQGQPLQAFANLSTDERSWLAWRLNQQLKTLNAQTGNDTETRSIGRVVAVESPSDNSWTLVDDYDSTSFVQRGTLQLGAVLGVLFATLFWNGIVSVFVMTLIGVAPGGPPQFSGEWWGLCAFLVPFEVIGLLIAFALLLAVIDPVRRTTWRFERYEIRFSHTWLGLGYRRRYDSTAVARVFVDLEGVNGKNNSGKLLIIHPTTTGDVRLRFSDDQNTEIVSINGLTEGEALWMMDNLRRQHSDWFRS
jgi:hypothetical protein